MRTLTGRLRELLSDDYIPYDYAQDCADWVEECGVAALAILEAARAKKIDFYGVGNTLELATTDIEEDVIRSLQKPLDDLSDLLQAAGERGG